MAVFSTKLEELLRNKQSMTMQSLIENFAEKSFAILLLLLLAIPALPLPTGGVTHIFEIIAMLLAIELIAGRKTVWLPQRWLTKPLPQSLQASALPKFVKIIRWLEKYSKPRLPAVETNKLYIRILGLIILVFTIFAFLAPPFSGLDTLPALGVVLLSISLIFKDIVLSLAGFIIGCAGILLILILSRVVFQLL